MYIHKYDTVLMIKTFQSKITTRTINHTIFDDFPQQIRDHYYLFVRKNVLLVWLFPSVCAHVGLELVALHTREGALVTRKRMDTW